MKPILEIKNIRKNFNGQTAVDGVSFKVREGICFGLLGPNGAGKTTTLEIIEDIITPDNGQIFYQGQPRSSSFREEIGIQFQHTSLLNFLTVAETLDSFHRLYQEPDQINNLIERCELTPLLNKRNNQLSGRQLQRLMPALALITRPPLVFLDEPSNCLVPHSPPNLSALLHQSQPQR
ncbi:MAG: ABC transporter ATP-binding protein, partial [Desulfobulbaceae bacterium]|nr:ABC transporter ATP-binding protein [Candidatus Desulfatifera sulfidica]